MNNRDKQRELQEKKKIERLKKASENPIESLRNRALGAAAVVGTSAAYLHRSGKYAKFSRAMTRTTKAIGTALKETGIAKKENLTISDFKNFKKHFNESKRIQDATGENAGIKISHQNPGNFFSALIQKEVATRDPSKQMRAAVNAAAKVHAYNKVDEMLTQGDVNLERRLKRHADSVVLHIGNPRKLDQIRRSGSFSQEELALVSQVESSIGDFLSDTKKINNIAKQVHNEIKQLKSQKTDVGALEKLYGTADTDIRRRSVTEKITGSRGLTIGELLNNEHAVKGNKVKVKGIRKEDEEVTHPTDELDIIQLLKEKAAEIKANDGDDAYRRFMNITPDAANLRVNAKGEFYSNEGLETVKNWSIKSLAYTMPGKILKLGDISQDKIAPTFAMFNEGELNGQLAAIGNNNKDKTLLDRRMYYSDGKFFASSENGLEELDYEQTKNLKLGSGRFGSRRKLLRSMWGEDRYLKADNPLAHALDLGQEKEVYRHGLLDGIKSMMRGNDEDSTTNILNRQIYTTAKQMEDKAAFDAVVAGDTTQKAGAQRYVDQKLDDIETVLGVFNNNLRSMSGESIEALNGKVGVKAQELLDVLKENDVNAMVDRLIDIQDARGGDYLTGGLNKIVNGIKRDPVSVLSETKRRNTQDNVTYTSSLVEFFTDSAREKEVADYEELIRTELTKSIFQFQSQEAKGHGAKSGIELIEEANISIKEKANLKTAAAFAHLEEEAGISEVNSADLGSSFSLQYEMIDSYNEILRNGKNAEDVNARNVLQKFANDYKSSNSHGSIEAEDLIGEGAQMSEWIVQRKSWNPLDMIADLNNDTKSGNSITDLFKQLKAGRNDRANVSDLTLAPYFFLHRLNEIGTTFNVGLSNDSMASTYDMAKGILLKRVMPVGLGLTAYEWGDDTSQEITGKSFSGAVAEGAADIDVASRRVMDATGITGLMKDQYSINPIMQYWGDGGQFNDANELEKYYTKGYAPVRKGAWWTFGSVNEARGGEIQYWQPTFMRRIQSDYKDKSLYDGYADKWSHSWLPTPTNPLSPVAALLDPYWLEEKHADDRPYAISGNMFEDNTPWGAVLNNTIGDIIKPQKELHSGRLRGGVDIKANLYAMNQAIKQKAMDAFGTNEFQLRNDQLIPVNVNSYGSLIDGSPMVQSFMSQTSIKHYNPESGEFEMTPSVAARHPNDMQGYVPQSQLEIIRDKTLGDFYPSKAMKRGMNNVVGGGFGYRPVAGGGVGLTPAFDANGAPVTPLNQIPLRVDGKDIHYATLDEENSNALLARFKAGDGVIAEDEKGNMNLYTTNTIHNELKIRNEGMDFLYKYAFQPVDYVAEGFTDMKPSSGLMDATKAITSTFKDMVHMTPYSKVEKLWGGNEKPVEVKMRNMGESDDGDYVITPDKLKNYRPAQGMALLDDPDSVVDLINKGKGGDMVKEAATSARLIAGIYGYASGEVTGLGTDQDKRIATSQDMTSASRGFWDNSFGGAGGSLMEIARRFVPDYRRNARVSPLMNTMPEWMPDRFRWGDPYTLVPKGEMRLPGKGYESLNELHPDQFGQYGAFDRYKILADLAPFSEEYKMWRDIAQKTVDDPELQDEMQEIRDRVNRQGKKHEFYDYKILGNNLEYKQVVVSEIDKYGKFKAGDMTFKIAGVSIKANEGETTKADDDQSMVDVLGKYIHPGMVVTVAVDADESQRLNKDSVGSMNAAVFVDGENIAAKMIEEGDARKKRNDTSVPAVLANYGEYQKMLGAASEFVAHLDVPFLSDQFLRVRSPLESYKAEQVYGTPYQTWEHPIDTFLMPALTRATYDSGIGKVMASHAYSMFEKYANEKGMGTFNRRLGQSAYLLTNRGAFTGAALGAFIGVPSMRAAKAVATLTEAGHVLTGGNSRLDNTLVGADVGLKVATFFEKEKGVGALIGAGVGLALNVMSSQGNNDWIPSSTKKKWDLDEYFDRLTYIKYEGLYHEAARRAASEEGVDVEDYLKKKEAQREKNDEDLTFLKNIKKSLAKKGDVPGLEDFKKDINKKLNAVLADKPDDIVNGGKWTQAALLYKQVADSTVQGLTDKSSWSQLITALPTNEREYFTEFVKVSNPDKRQEILRTSSQSLRHALSLAWHMDDKWEDNETYFKNHAMPKEDWEGWDPNVDLKDVEVKTIENEGMNLADFGFYESQLSNPGAIVADPLNIKKKKQNASDTKEKLRKALQGKGLHNIDISVEPGPPGGINQVTANIKRWVTNKDTIQKRKELKEKIEREL